MMRSRYASALSGTVLFVFAGIVAAGDTPEGKAPLNVGDKAPAFSLKDCDGKEVKLADYAGKIVIIEWINRQCPFTQSKHDDKTMENTWARYKDKTDQVAWLAVDSSHYAKPEENGKFAKKMGVTYPILHDPDGAVGKAYGARTTPHMFVLDKSGVVIYMGAIDNAPPRNKPDTVRNYVAEAVDAALMGSTVEVSHTKPYGCSVKYATE